MIVQSLIISEISVNLVEFLAKSDTHALNAHMVVSQNVVKNLITFFYIIFLIHSHNLVKIDDSNSDN